MCYHRFDDKEADVPKAMSRTRLLRAFARTDGGCAFCGVALHLQSDWVVHRVLAKARGGDNDDANLVPSCARCNGRKKTKTPDEFRSWFKSRILEDLGS